MPHHIEVDQSGRADRFNEDTALALSDGIQYSILLTAAVKRACYQRLRERKMPKRVAVVRLFAAGLVVLLEGKARELESICIDLEFPGWEGEIQRHLLRHLKWLRKDQIYFAAIGKRSPAHGLAFHTWRREREADKKVESNELLRACR
jgi:hypothetical protein